MHFTAHTRLRLSDKELFLIEELMDVAGKARRAAANNVWVKGANLSTIGSWIRSEFGLHSKHGDGIRVELSQIERNWRELTASKMRSLGRELAYFQRLTYENEKALSEARTDWLKNIGNKKAESRRIAKLKSALFSSRSNADQAKSKLSNLSTELKAGIPTICFGGASLAREKHLVGTKGSNCSTAAQWRQKWIDQRNRQMLFPGSVSDVCGNTSCRFDPQAKTLTISLAKRQIERRVDELRASFKRPPSRLPGLLETRRLVIDNVSLPAKHAALHEHALANGQPIQIRFVRKRLKDNSIAIYLCVGFEIESHKEVETSQKILGIRFDASSIDWALVKEDGNLLKWKSMDSTIHSTMKPICIALGDRCSAHVAGTMNWKLATKEATETKDKIQSVASRLVRLAQSSNASLAIEAESYEAHRKSTQETRSASSIMSRDIYSSFCVALARNAERLGVHISQTDSSGNGASGPVKYGVVNALSEGCAMAMCIARKAALGSEAKTRKSAASGKSLRRAKKIKYQERVALPRSMPMIELHSINRRPRGIAWEVIAQVLGSREIQRRAMLSGVSIKTLRLRSRRGRKASSQAACGKRIAPDSGEPTGNSLLAENTPRAV